jgi:ectoine hydroxylase
MYLTREQVAHYNEKGFLLLPDYFSAHEVARLKAELPAVFAGRGPERVMERGGQAVRSVYGSHATNESFRRLTRDARVVEPARQILEDDVYVYQFKINVKAGFAGDVWQWHQDFIFWRNEDGMPDDRVINMAIFLDEVNEFNAPMFLIPGSHKEGVIEVPARRFAVGGARGADPEWVSNLTAELKYSLDKRTVSALAEKYGMVAPKGPAGSVLIFHSNLAHASASNISPFDRVVVFITFNSVCNKPVDVDNPRPEFLASRDNRPVEAIADRRLFARAAG